MTKGERIRFLRKRAGLTQEELAKDLGYSQASIDKIENGTQDLPVKKIKAISEVLGTTPDYIIGFEATEEAGSITEPDSAGHLPELLLLNRMLMEQNGTLIQALDRMTRFRRVDTVTYDGFTAAEGLILDALRRCCGEGGWGACLGCPLIRDKTGRDCGKLLPALALTLINNMKGVDGA